MAVVNIVAILAVVRAVNPTSATINQPGSMTQACTYSVFTDGTNAFSRDCKTGAITYSGSNATTVIQNSINAAIPLYGSVRLAPGTYSVTGLTIQNGSASTRGFALRGSAGAFPGTVLSYSGPAGGTVLTMNACQWCAIDSIDFNGTNTAATALSVQAISSGVGSLSDFISNSVFHYTTTNGILFGATNNFQVSEINLESVNVLDTVTGIQLKGTNTLNIVSTGLNIGRSQIGLNVTSGSFFGYDTTFTSNTVADVFLFRNAAPIALYGGYSEQGAMLLKTVSDAGQFYAGYAIDDFKYLPGTPGANVVDDYTVGPATFSRVFFGNGATLTFRGLFGSSTPPAVKRIVSSWFFTSGGSPVNGTANIIHGLYKDAQIVFDTYPLGWAPTPFASWGSDSGLTPLTTGTHVAGPTSSSTRNYTVDAQKALVYSTGGTGVQISVWDRLGNRVLGLDTTKPFLVPIGYNIGFGAWSGAPTVSVYFIGV